MKYEKMLDFLLFGYFGCDGSDGADTMRNRAAHRAYLDLARTVSYSSSTSQLAEKLKKRSSEYEKKEAETFIKKKEALVDSVCERLYPLPSGDFDAWHQEKCEEICRMMDDSGLLGEPFTCGQAQKWVNMTLKYLWLLDLLPEEIKEESLHVPIDSFILQRLSKQVSDVTGSGETYCYKHMAWSAITEYTDYKDLQAEIKKITPNPIRWEGEAWIAVAKMRAAMKNA